MKEKLYEVWLHLTADKKRAGVLLVLVIVLVVLGARALLSTAGPSRARASNEPESQVTLREQINDRFARTLASIGTGNGGTFVELRPVGRLERNLFALDPEHFPDASQTEQPDANADGAVAPSQQKVDETPDGGVSVEERVLEESSSFKLRSTLVGRTPIAVIEIADGHGKRRVVLSPGQSIEGFELREVRSNAVVLEKQGVRVELKRALPED